MFGLYQKVKGMATVSKGLTLLPKLRREHVNLTSYSKMRVDLAAQVLLLCKLLLHIYISH